MSQPNETDPRLWDARYFVYAFFAKEARPPSIQDAARELQITPEQARALYEELDARHALTLLPGTHTIRMANPFSGVPTGFHVRVGAKQYYANCAWDSFGIPAALHRDAAIEAFCAQTQKPLRLNIEDGNVSGDSAVMYFRVPFAQWYDDLVFT